MELRPELMPRRLDKKKVARLAELAANIDGATPGTWEEDLEEFNRIAGTNFDWSIFQGIYGGMEHSTWVRQVLSDRSAAKIPDITYDELLELVTRIYTAKGKQHEIYFWLKLLKVNLDPQISDLIFWPGEYFGDGDNTRKMTPKEILDTALKTKKEKDKHH